MFVIWLVDFRFSIADCRFASLVRWGTVLEIGNQQLEIFFAPDYAD